MTITTTAVDVTYSPDGSTTGFAIPFAFADGAHVKVRLNGVLLNSGFAVTGEGSPSGGALLFDTAPAAGTETLYVFRQTPLTQQIDAQNNSTIFASVLAEGLDLGVLRAQEVVAYLNRAIAEAGESIGLINKVGYDALAATGGAELTGTRDGDTVQEKLDLMGAPPALLPERFYLTNEMSPAEITDVATQAGGLDLSTKLNALLAEADGRIVVLPNDGRIRLNSPIGRTTSAGTTFTPGTKMIGGNDTILDSRVNNAALIKLDTSASLRFQDDVILENFRIHCAMGGTAVQRSAIQLERIVRAKLYNLTLEDPYRGLHVLIDENDAGGSNQILVDRLNVKRALKWGVDIDPTVGANDLSYFSLPNSQFNQCGVDERRAISAIALGTTTTITTTVAHGFSTGEWVTIYNAGLSLDTEIENWTDQITVTGANTYTIARNTTGRAAYTGTGPTAATAMRQDPLSGSVRIKAQMGHLGDQTWITESRNVGILIPYGGGGVGGYKTTIHKFTVENCVGVPILINNADGVTVSECDLRYNEALGGPSLAMIRLDAAQAGVKGVRIRDNTIIGFNPSGTNSLNIAHSGQQSGASGLDDIIIDNPIYKDYSDVNHIRYGAGIFAAQKPNVIEDGRALYEMRPFFKSQVNTASPTYTPDLRKASRHILVLEAGTTGTVTIASPPNYGAANATRNGQDFEIVIINASGGTLNLAYGLATVGAPTTIANGVTKIGKWSFAAQTAWIQSATWV